MHRFRIWLRSGSRHRLHIFLSCGTTCSAGIPTEVGELPDREIVTRVSGPEPGYKATPIFIVQAALLLLEQHAQLGAAGVHTPAALLGAQGYVERLQKSGIKFEQLSSKQL